MRDLEVIHLGRIGYRVAIEQMEARLAARLRGEGRDALFLLEHEPVLTLGRRGRRDHILASPEKLSALGIEVHETGRGGDVTYHGPGQIVGYPVIDLSPDRRDVHRYVGDLEELMIRSCRRYGVDAGRIQGLTGTWIEGNRKIGAIGVRISRWFTSHGFAFNVSSSLDAFALIVPCGIRDKSVTSLSAELGRPLSLEQVSRVIEDEFRGIFC